MLRIEDWAKQNEFFEFKKSDGRYHFYKLARYGDCLKAASKEVAQISKELTRIVDLLIPMDTEEAEVLATVYAAWNNMLIDGAPLSDDAIVYAARDDWHLEKLKIPRQRFLEAISALRLPFLRMILSENRNCTFRDHARGGRWKGFLKA